MMSAGSAETDDFSGKFGRRPQANLGEERQQQILDSTVSSCGGSYLDQSVPMRASTIMKRTIMAIMTETQKYISRGKTNIRTEAQKYSKDVRFVHVEEDHHDHRVAHAAAHRDPRENRLMVRVGGFQVRGSGQRHDGIDTSRPAVTLVQSVANTKGRSS